MPILSKRDNPPSRHPDGTIIESTQTWWIAKVKTRQEKALAADLYDRGVEYYLPYYVKTSRRADSSSLRKSLNPLFPSYVPFAIENDPWFLLQLNRISTIIPVKAQMKFKQELNQIYLAYERNLEITPVSGLEYNTGELVKVIAGPMAGIHGRIVRTGESDLLVLRVEGLGDASVSIDIKYVTSVK